MSDLWTWALIGFALTLFLPWLLYASFRAISYGWHRGKREATRDVLRNGRQLPTTTENDDA